MALAHAARADEPGRLRMQRAQRAAHGRHGLPARSLEQGMTRAGTRTRRGRTDAPRAVVRSGRGRQGDLSAQVAADVTGVAGHRALARLEEPLAVEQIAPEQEQAEAVEAAREQGLAVDPEVVGDLQLLPVFAEHRDQKRADEPARRRHTGLRQPRDQPFTRIGVLGDDLLEPGDLALLLLVLVLLVHPHSAVLLVLPLPKFRFAGVLGQFALRYFVGSRHCVGFLSARAARRLTSAVFSPARVCDDASDFDVAPRFREKRPKMIWKCFRNWLRAAG